MSRLPLIFLLAFSAASAALPEPPNQHAPWTPPALDGLSLPPYVIAASAKLFASGMADPRGGEYREIEIAGRSPEDGNRRTRGWVFAAGYAVCWDGMVYPVLRVEEPADLSADVRDIVGLHVTRQLGGSERLEFYENVAGSGWMPSSPIPLLVRLGRADLASELYLSFFQGRCSGRGRSEMVPDCCGGVAGQCLPMPC